MSSEEPVDLPSLIELDSPEDIPDFASDEEAAEYWDIHAPGPQFFEGMPRERDSRLPPPRGRPATQSLTVIHGEAEVPTFADEREEQEFWATHTLSEKMLENFREPENGLLPPSRPETRRRRS